MRKTLIKKTPNRQKNSTNLRSGKNDHFAKAIVWHNINGQKWWN